MSERVRASVRAGMSQSPSADAFVLRFTGVNPDWGRGPIHANLKDSVARFDSV